MRVPRELLWLSLAVVAWAERWRQTEREGRGQGEHSGWSRGQEAEWETLGSHGSGERGEWEGASFPDYATFMELVAAEKGRGLFPHILNLAANSVIDASATCGLSGPESYCKLVEHVFMRQPQCDICDDLHPAKRHPIQMAIDGTNDWWQSPSLANGVHYEKINITIDLRQEYQVAYVIVKAGIAPRPGSWVLERSLDGETWKPWQYFAESDGACERRFGLPATKGLPRYDSDTHVICTSYYARLDPLEGGEIHVSLVNGRPGSSGPSQDLQDFTRTRYVRLRLLKLRTLNADLMIINRRSPDNPFIDQSVSRRYFYSLKDISIGGQCICNGHADTCPVDPASGQMKCHCRHNTCGESCSKCCPLFNAKPWASGTHDTPNVCQACQCFHHADECVYDEAVEAAASSVSPDGVYEGGGRCVDCRHRTRGLNCEECLERHYRPAGVSHYSPEACQPCECDETGSVDGSCVEDETRAAEGQAPGDCRCKPGFGGRRCERCAEGFRNYPTCEPCPCHRAGSSNFATCEDRCVCKPNVEGEFCDRCKAQHINLDENDPMGCQPCFCFGLSDQCSEFPAPLSHIRTLSNWSLTDQTGALSVPPDANGGGSLTFNARKHPGQGLYFWKAPEAFLGNLLKSYGGQLRYFVYHVPESGPEGRPESPVPVPDVVVAGNGARLEFFSRKQFFSRENVSVAVRLDEAEGGWYDALDRRATVDRRKLMRTLTNVHLFLLRAAYNHYQLQSSLYGVSLERAGAEGGEETEGRLSSVEQCVCPPGTSGLSCEGCPLGHRRVDNVLYEGRCEACECNGHAEACDPFTAACLDCRHNTTGAACEFCLQGWYGNPSLGGGEGACRPCACPLLLPSNNFSPTCALAHSSSTPDYICTACETGYQGPKCQECADGFFGEPEAPGEVCRPCDCSGNTDPAAVGNCDRRTGECLKCTGNTAGDKCERCAEEFWGQAVGGGGCFACDCHIHGAVSTSCANDTGLCECNQHFVGDKCSRCEEGHGDVEAGCPECGCDETGSLGDACDPVSGQCQCRPGVFGKRCDKCQTGYFGFSEQGCQWCGCDALGSEEDGSCDSQTGQCLCRPHVEGKACDRCEDGFYNISSKEGCSPCECGLGTAAESICDAETGQCRCQPGATGLRCDTCAPNHFGLSAEGCSVCPVCPAPGHVCHPETGECVCPTLTEGELCEDCVEDSWDHHPLEGCKACECDEEGANGTACDVGGGQCACRQGYTGRRCDQCRHGHFQFPDCRQCKCGLGGTEAGSCRDGLCGCDEAGQCSCKPNVEGKKCKACKEDAFSLLPDYPQGCVSCFCFGRSEFCVQATYVWQQIYADDRLALFAQPYAYYEQMRGLRVFPQAPPTLNSFPTDNTPIYWPLPSHFHGDRVTSYNGFLRFRVYNQDGNSISGVSRPDPNHFFSQPLVVLVGNHRIVLEHYPKDQPNEKSRYKVRLREEMWRSRTAPELPVTREMLMVALQNIQAIYVRGTFSYGVAEAALEEVSLDVGVWQEETEEEAAGETALGVESCGDCPQGYQGSSCQNPAEGYCRKREQYYLDSEDDLALVGTAEPCACHGHSLQCHSETCRCQDCQDHTTGDFCQLCEDGYFGDATLGSPEDCGRCECPRADASFSPTCRADASAEGGFVCDRCEQGYEGVHCERCGRGYFGAPVEEGGRCEECACHADGSLSRDCDPLTGQCQCRSGVTGRDCSQCQPRHALIGAVCTSCDQGCSLPLMQDVDTLDQTISSYNFSGLVPMPWKRLARVGNASQDRLDDLEALESGKEEAAEMVAALDSESSSTARKDAEALGDQAQFVQKRMEEKVAKLQTFIDQSGELDEQMTEAYNKAWEYYSILSNYAAREGRGRGVDVEARLREAVEVLKRVKERTDYLQKRKDRAELELGKAEELKSEMMAKKLNDTVLEDLHERMERVSDVVEKGYLLAWDSARRQAISATNVTAINERRREQLEMVGKQLESMEAEATDNLQTGEDRVAGASSFNLEAFDSHLMTNGSLMPGLAESMEECEKTASQYNQLLREYAGSEVVPAQRRAEELERQAAELERAFVYTKDASSLALAAAGAYDSILDALRNSTDAAESAKAAADTTAATVADESLLAQASDALQLSQDLKDEAAGLGSVAAETQQFEKRLGAVNLDLVAKEKELEMVRADFSDLDEQHDAMELVEEKTKAGKAKAEETKGGVERMAERVNKLAEELKPFTEAHPDAIRDLAQQLNETTRRLSNLNQLVNATASQALRNDDATERLAQKMALLKEKISEARQKASKIKLSVRAVAGSGCVREYVSPLAPSPVTSVEVRFRPLRGVPDSLLFLTRTLARRTQPSEYLALTLQDARFVLHWDIGSEPQTLTLAHNIQWLPEPNHWYHVAIRREANAANLTVSTIAVEREGEQVVGQPVTVSQDFGGDKTLLNTRPGTTKVTVGGKEDEAPETASVWELRGSVGSLKLGERPLALWDFVDSEGRCDGDLDTYQPSEPQREGYLQGHMLRDGYAQVPVDPGSDTFYELTRFNIALRFAAYSPSGLLYFRGEENQDFVAIQLKEGRVVLQFNLGQTSSLTLTSTRSDYNDGKLHTVMARRMEKNATLMVDEDDEVTDLAPGSMTGLNIRNSPHFLGGVPPSKDRGPWARFELAWEGFYGCLEGVQPDMRFAPLDLARASRSLNLEQGCLLEDERLQTRERVASFAGDGFLVLPGLTLPSEGSLAFAFRTRQANATLLYQSSRVTTYARRRREMSGQGFLAAYLYQGSLVFILGTDSNNPERGQTVVTLRAEVSHLSDGNLHSVFLERAGSTVSLSVDDRAEAEGRLGDTALIGSPRAQLFLAGLPEGTAPSPEELPTPVVPLAGCVSDLFLNFHRLPLLPESHSNAKIGSCTTRPDQSDQPDQPEQQPQPGGAGGGLGEAGGVQADERASARRREAYGHADVPLSSESLPSVLDALAEPSAECAGRLEAADPKSWTEPPARFGNGVAGESYAEASLKTLGRVFTKTNNFSIAIQFKTRKPDGLIFFWGNKKFKQWLELRLTGGRLQLTLQKRKAYTLRVGKTALDDDRWHTVTVLKQMRELGLSADGGDGGAASLPLVPETFRTLRRRFFLAGFPNKLRANRGFTTDTHPQLKGCLRGFTFKDKPVHILRFAKGAQPCTKKAQRSAAQELSVPSNGYAVFRGEVVGQLSLRLAFRTGSAGGRLFLLESEAGGAVLEAVLWEGRRVEVRLLVDGAVVAELRVEASGSLCSGAWAQLWLGLAEGELRAELSGAAFLGSGAAAAASAAFPEGPVSLSVGGAAEAETPSLVGCFRNVRLGDDDGLKLASLKRAVLGVCPFAQPTEAPSLN